jgi:hypothetical protein
MRKILTAALLAAILSACSSEGGFQRGVFYGKVIDQTPEQVQSAFGKPDSVDISAPDNPRYVYNKKTFNPDNMNKVDDRTIVEFAKGKDGKIICTDVTYM